MDENKESVQKEEYQVIQEQIMPKKKVNWQRVGKKLLRTGGYALVFGVIAGAVMVASGRFFVKQFGLAEPSKQVVGIGNGTPTPALTGNPAATKTPAPTKTPTVTDPVTTQGLPQKVTPSVEVDVENGKTNVAFPEVPKDETIQGFLNVYSGLVGLAGELERSIVKVTAITEGVDWFEESYEITKNASALYVGDNGIDLLFITNLDSIEGATKFEVTFGNGETVEGALYSYDTNYRLAVLAVRFSAVGKFAKEDYPEKAVFALGNVIPGTPVMVLGNPNGHMGAMELGMVTGNGKVAQIIDDEIRYFTTGITEYAAGDGFVFNMAGEVIGIVSGSLNQGESGVITATMAGNLQDVIVKLLNNIPRMYSGMRLETIEKTAGSKNKLPEGVYVAEVLPSSPAMNAGIKNGDIITMVGILPVTDARQYYEEINSAGPQTIRVIVSREIKGERKEQTLYIVPEVKFH